MAKILQIISNIGINSDMPSHKKKSIVLLNRISVLVIIFFSVISIMSYIKLSLPTIGHLFAVNVLIIALSFLLTKKQKADLTIYIL